MASSLLVAEGSRRPRARMSDPKGELAELGLWIWQRHRCQRECKKSSELASCPHKCGDSKCHLGIFFSNKLGLVHITGKLETWIRSLGVYFSVL